MKKQIMRALSGFALLTVLTASAYAHTGRRLSVHVPFDFVVAGKKLPAGDYSVRRVSKDSATALLIRSEDGRSVATGITTAAPREALRAQLSLRRRGESYFLASVSIPGTAGVREVPPSKGETRRTRELIGQAKAVGGDAADKTVTVTGSVE